MLFDDLISATHTLLLQFVEKLFFGVGITRPAAITNIAGHLYDQYRMICRAGLHTRIFRFTDTVKYPVPVVDIECIQRRPLSYQQPIDHYGSVFEPAGGVPDRWRHCRVDHFHKPGQRYGGNAVRGITLGLTAGPVVEYHTERAILAEFIQPR